MFLSKINPLAISALSLLLPISAVAESYVLDTAHTSVDFKVRHLGINNVKGSFQKFSGTIEYNKEKPEETKVTAEIDTGSLNTSNGDRDKHVKSKDFLNVSVFPKIKFTSTETKKGEDDTLLVTGDLTILGITKPITLTVSELTGPGPNPLDKKNHVGAVVTGKLTRQDFGVSWNGGGMTGVAGEAAIGDEIKLQFEVDGVEK